MQIWTNRETHIFKSREVYLPPTPLGSASENAYLPNYLRQIACKYKYSKFYSAEKPARLAAALGYVTQLAYQRLCECECDFFQMCNYLVNKKYKLNRNCTLLSKMYLLKVKGIF